NRINAGANSAARFSDLLISRARDALFKIHKSRVHKNRVRVRIHKTRQDHLAATIDLDNFLPVLLDPGIRQGVFGFGNGNNLSAYTQHSAVFNNAEIVEFRPSPRSRFAGPRAKGKELAEIGWK